MKINKQHLKGRLQGSQNENQWSKVKHGSERRSGPWRKKKSLVCTEIKIFLRIGSLLVIDTHSNHRRLLVFCSSLQLIRCSMDRNQHAAEESGPRTTGQPARARLLLWISTISRRLPLTDEHTRADSANHNIHDAQSAAGNRLLHQTGTFSRWHHTAEPSHDSAVSFVFLMYTVNVHDRTPDAPQVTAAI